MWKCPKCDTANDGKFCIICGEAQPQAQNNSNYQKTQQSGGYTKYNFHDEPPIFRSHPETLYKKQSNPLIAVCITLAVLLTAILICLVVLITKKDDTNTSNQTVATETSAAVATPTYSPTPVPTVPPTPTPVKTPVPTPSPVPTQPPAPQAVSYTMYTNSQFNLQCAYPSNFTPTTPKGYNGLKAVKSPDSTSVITIRARVNDVGMTIDQALGEFYDAFSGNVNYEYVGSDYYIISITNGNRTRYRKFFIDQENFYCLDFEYDNKDAAISAEYINYIEDSFRTM